jgi:hypothetical protein
MSVHLFLLLWELVAAGGLEEQQAPLADQAEEIHLLEHTLLPLAVMAGQLRQHQVLQLRIEQLLVRRQGGLTQHILPFQTDLVDTHQHQQP